MVKILKCGISNLVHTRVKCFNIEGWSEYYSRKPKVDFIVDAMIINLAANTLKPVIFLWDTPDNETVNSIKQ